MTTVHTYIQKFHQHSHVMMGSLTLAQSCVFTMLYCFGADIPQLSSAPTLNPNSSSIILSWSPTQLTPNKYRISYSCQLICGSLVTHQAFTVDGNSTSRILSATPGSSCSVSVLAVFGTSIFSNTVTSSINTTSAGMYMIHGNAYMRICQPT